MIKLPPKLKYIPLEYLFRTGVFFRNLWYNYFSKGYRFPIKIISVGNLSVGGTGKTPMAEWLIRFAQKKNIQTAYLSRGYGRKTKGFLLVNPLSHTSNEVGDEALQVASNFDIPVAVCENRVLGTKQLLSIYPDIQLLILDDAFQHRKIYRDLDILMIDPTNSPFHDFVLPRGRLREPVSSLKRAHWVVISKSNLASQNEVKKLLSKISIPKSKAKLISYALKNCFDETEIPLNSISRNPCFAVSGIGNNKLFIQQLFATHLNVIEAKSFKDHYVIKENELKKIVKKCKNFVRNQVFEIPPIIVMTEKDYYRLKNLPYFVPSEIDMYYLKVGFEIENIPSSIDNFFMQFQTSNSDSNNLA